MRGQRYADAPVTSQSVIVRRKMSGDGDSETFISLVKERRALYDNSLPEHTNRNLTEKLWREIAAKTNKSVAECKLKWASLRNSYARALRYLKQQASGSGVRKKEWYLCDAMSFLSEYMQHRGSDVNTSVKSNGSEDLSEEEAEESPDNIEPRVCFEESVDTKRRKISRRKKASTRPEATPAIGDSAQPLTNLSARTAGTTSAPVDNPEEHFLKSLLPDIVSLSKKRRRVFKEFVMHKLNRLMDAEEDGTVSDTPLCVSCQGSIKPDIA